MLVFILPEFQSWLYGKVAKYLLDLLIASKIPCGFIDDCSQLKSSDTLVIFYDYLVQKMEKEPAKHSHVQQFILVEIEPQINMDQWYRKEFLEKRCRCIVTFTKREGDWLKQNYKIPTFIIYQGYSELEDTFRNQGNTAPQYHCDILMPGCDNTPDRIQIVKELRSAGLVVDTLFLIGEKLDQAIRTSKICAYYPASQQHQHYPTQRINWCLNKGACVVAVKSCDEELEKYYAPLLISCDRSSFVSKCKEVIQSGQWIEFQKQSYLKYKAEYNAVQNFERSGWRQWLFVNLFSNTVA